MLPLLIDFSLVWLVLLLPVRRLVVLLRSMGFLNRNTHNQGLHAGLGMVGVIMIVVILVSDSGNCLDFFIMLTRLVIIDFYSLVDTYNHKQP